MNKRVKGILKGIIGIVFLLLLLFLVFRNPILHWQIDRTKSALKQRTGAIFDIKAATFSGFLSVALQDISLTPINGDTLLLADTANIRVSFWTLFVGVVRIKELYFSGASITISCRDSICNYAGFLHQKKISTSKSEKNYSIFLKSILDRVFNFAPQRSLLKDIFLKYKNDSMESILEIKEFHSDESSLSGIVMDLKSKSIWKCTGFFSQLKHSLNVKCYPENSTVSKLPLSNELFGLLIGFDTLHLSLDGYKWARNLLTAGGSVSIENLSAFHKKMSDDTVKVSSASFDFIIHAGKTFMEIDSTSKATLASIQFHPYLKYDRGREKEYVLNIKTDKIEATEFFSSLPNGMFDEVRTIQADGKMQFVMNFKINTTNPDSLLFESSLRKEGFRIRRFGTSELMKMNGEFLQSVYEKDRFIRSFNVGYSNPFYTPLDSISPYFINSVLTSEDGNFFYHNGFNEDAFRKSIITNFKAGKFVRGGSTISMQLVKNVFLSRKKTISRKAEEALLVWIIESNHLYTKKECLKFI